MSGKTQTENIISKIFKLNKKIRFVAIISDNGKILYSEMKFDKNCSYHLYWILVKNRKKFREKLYENGIETGTHYKPIHLMKMYNHDQKLPVTESAGKQIVTIPIHPNLKDSQIKKIIKCVNKFS